MSMRKKRIIAAILVASITISGLSGMGSVFAKKDLLQEEEATEVDNSLFEAQPQDESEIVDEVDGLYITSEEQVIYSTARIEGNDGTSDVYNLGAEEIERLMEKGATVEELFQLDEIANRLMIDPEALFDKKEDTGKSLTEIEEEIVEERKQESLKEIKEEHPEEYEILESEGISEDEIITFFTYQDMNNGTVSKELAKIYAEEGEESFTEDKHSLSEKKRKKYGLTKKEAKNLDEETVKAMERISKRSGESTEDILASYKGGK